MKNMRIFVSQIFLRLVSPEAGKYCTFINNIKMKYLPAHFNLFSFVLNYSKVPKFILVAKNTSNCFCCLAISAILTFICLSNMYFLLISKAKTIEEIISK